MSAAAAIIAAERTITVCITVHIAGAECTMNVHITVHIAGAERPLTIHVHIAGAAGAAASLSSKAAFVIIFLPTPSMDCQWVEKPLT